VRRKELKEVVSRGWLASELGISDMRDEKPNRTGILIWMLVLTRNFPGYSSFANVQNGYGSATP
jgi:hypothetical protein